MKTLFKIVVALVLLLVVAVLALPLWVGPVVTGVANAVVPGMTKTEFKLSEFSLNPYSGRLALGGLRLGNPAGFRPDTAVSVGSLGVSADATTALSDVVIIEKIALRDVFVSYVKNDGRYNFEVIAENAAGPSKPEEPEKAEAPKPAKEEGGKSKKVIIDRVVIENVMFQWGPVPVPVPPIQISGIGRSTGGTDWETAWKELSAKVLSALGGVGVSLKDLGVDTAKIADELSKAGVQDAQKVVDAVKDVKIPASAEDLKGLEDSAKAAAEAFKGAGGDTQKALKDAGDKLKGLFGK